MSQQEVLMQSCRVALAGMLHDLGKFHERTGLPLPGNAPALETLYRYSHAAHTAGVWEEITDCAPDLLQGDVSPFASRSTGEDITDSLVNAAAAHHHPDTFLQWIIATADRAASGFERQQFADYNADAEGETFTRKNRYQARLVSLFDQIEPARPLDHAYPLAALSPDAIFVRIRTEIEPKNDKAAQAEYAALWQQFMAALASIPTSHRAHWPLWLDHFDSAWLAFTHAIPSATNRNVVPDVSLYDHSRAVAALAVALWRWHHENGKVGADETAQLADPERPDWIVEKLLLIQGDFFGIQDFIFANGGATQKHAHKLLRGRSFQVALLAELAALRLLEALQLPSTSQIINAAGKFLIVAPNTDQARAAVAQCRREFDGWCLAHTFGEIGVGLASTPASCKHLVGGAFKQLINTLFRALDTAKHRRFDLCGEVSAVMPCEFPHGPCEYHGRYPANRAREEGEEGKPASCALSRDQIAIGEALTKRARLLVLRNRDSFDRALELDYFGYRIAFVAEEEVSGKYGNLAREHTLLRAWDFDLPDADGTTFRGYARRFVNSFVPRQDDGTLKTLEDIAAAGTGEIALVTLKGDVDYLGTIFQDGLEQPTFARWAALSRQVNAFFALWLPWHCAQNAPDTYTVFAGGDDFFLIGPWEDTIKLAGQMRTAFSRYVGRDDITFSLGATMTHPKTPARHLAEAAERGLDAAKKLPEKNDVAKVRPGKNGASLWGVTVGWDDWHALTGLRRERLAQLVEGESAGFLYGLLQLSDQADGKRPEDALWRSRLAYRTTRLVADHEKRRDLIAEIGDAMNRYKGAYRLPVSLLLYRERK